ncbi:MAG: hypothetical protein AB7O68_25370 [Pirellulales bacterium]
MIQSNTAFEASPGAARYYLLQHMPDVMRKETLNVGVIVHKGDNRAAQFLGDARVDGSPDGRSLKYISDTRVYRMWVRHWRKALELPTWQEQMLDSRLNSFQFINGGEVTDTGADSAEEICSYLFSMLVSHGGLAEALGGVAEDEDTVEIANDLRGEFRKLRLMRPMADDSVRHPIYDGFSARGATDWHMLTFYQETRDRGFAIEPLNLATRQRKHARERAGYLSFIFGDLRSGEAERKKPVNNFAVVRVGEEDRNDPQVQYCLNIAGKNADIVDWNDTRQREAFLKDRERIAHAA